MRKILKFQKGSRREKKNNKNNLNQYKEKGLPLERKDLINCEV